MLNRRIENDIKKWLKDPKTALMITGVRQCGKTFVIKKVLQESQCDFVSFNLIEQPEVVEVLRGVLSKDVSLFVQRLSLLTRKKLVKGKTIVFFDEIQEFKEILTAIKFLVEEGGFKYILSGSLLGVEIASLHSAPVGFVKTLRMFPLDLAEFMQAVGVSNNTLEILKDSFENKKSVDEFIHKKILDVFKMYLLVGGMPSAVQKYVDTNDLNATSDIHLDIIEQYKVDFTKYESLHKLKLVNTYNLIPSELAEKNRRFVLKNIDKTIKFDRYENSFLWLKDAGVSIPVYNVTEPRLPLVLNSKSSLFKLFLSDVGMLTTLYGNNTKLAILNNNPSFNAGSIYENFAAQELLCHGFDLYYFLSHKQGELDFVIEYNDKVLPIEIKSGKDYTRHIALNNVLSTPDYDIHQAFVFSNDNTSHKDQITYYPIYMLSFLRHSHPFPTIAKLDVNGL